MIRRHQFFVVAIVAVFAVLQGCSSSGTFPEPQIDNETLAVFAGQTLSVSEFEHEYARSAGGREAAADDSLAELEDFLERYVDFRLKVKAARDAGIHRDPEITQEIRNYQSQFARPYLLEQEVIEPVVKDLYEKQASMIEASHILIRVPGGAAPADTAAAYAQIETIVDSLEAGHDFGDLAEQFSEDPSASRTDAPLGFRGYLGYFSGGKMVAEFEDYAYATPVGQVSRIFRTQYGYHILKVTDKKPTLAPIRLSHIMVVVDSTTTDSAALAEISSIRDSIVAGSDFSTMASRHSDDTWSQQRGGDIGMQAYDDRLLPALKEPAFELENVGDVTEPIRTRFGYHLLQVTERGSLPSYEESYEDLKKQAMRLPRARQKEIEYGAKAMARLGSSYDTTTVVSFFAEAHEDSLEQYLRSNPFDSLQLATEVATIGDSSYVFNHVISTSTSRRFKSTNSVTDFVDDVMTQFLIDRAIDYDVAMLEETDPDFRETMEDFRDGLVLFKFMEDSVWTAAATDSVALRELYDSNPDNYRYTERSELVSFHGGNREQLTAMVEELRAGVDFAELDSALIAGPTGTVKVDTLTMASATESVFDRALDLEHGQYTDPVEYNRGFVVIKKNDTLPARTKTFDEAQSDLIAEYQTILEDQIIDRLRERYRVRTFPERLNLAYAPDDASTDMTSADSQ